MSGTAAFLSGLADAMREAATESATGSPETWRKTLTFMPKRPVPAPLSRLTHYERRRPRTSRRSRRGAPPRC